MTLWQLGGVALGAALLMWGPTPFDWVGFVLAFSSVMFWATDAR